MTPAQIHNEPDKPLGSGSFLVQLFAENEKAFRYKPFGERLGASVTDEEDPRFTDHEYDRLTNFNYMKGRFQMPTVGVFNRPDPMRDWDWTRPNTINLYQYVSNDPINKWDPFGFIERVKKGKRKGKIVASLQRDESNKPIRGQNAKGHWISVFTIKTNSGVPFYATKPLKDKKNPESITDCHGYTFTGGAYWVNDDQVQTILEGDGYEETDSPSIDDIAVFYAKEDESISLVDGSTYEIKKGAIIHSMVVTKAEDGDVEVTGLGGFEILPETHKVDQVPGFSAKADIKFFRGPKTDRDYNREQVKAYEEKVKEIISK